LEIVQVFDHRPEPSLVRGHGIERPAEGSVLADGSIELAGWLLGAAVPAVAVEVSPGDGDVIRVPLGAPRPDLAAAFPGEAGVERAGFAGKVEVAEPDGELELQVRGVLEDDRVVPLAAIRARPIRPDPRGPRWIPVGSAG
jgi:hypothetical protein